MKIDEEIIPGGLWESDAVLLRDHQHQTDSIVWMWNESEPAMPPEVPPCPHAHTPVIALSTFSDRTSAKRAWTIPRVIMMYNEGGYATTGACLDCIVTWEKASTQK